MSLPILLRSARRAAAVAAHARVGVSPATRFGSARLYSSTVHDNDPETLEREKQKNLSGKQHKTSTTHAQDAPGWNEYLATTSEAAVKADRSGTNGPEDLQRRSVEHIRARHHTPDEEETSGSTEAQYERDEVEGPLKGASKNTPGSHREN